MDNNQIFGSIKKLVGVSALSLGMSATAYAVPTLQLDIEGGTYDTVQEDIVAPGDTFTLLALLTPRKKRGSESESEYAAYIAALLADSYYISMALTPQTSVGADLGTVDINSTTVNVTADMVYGRPPLAGSDPGDLAKHSIYETYFYEYVFSYVSTDTCATYNSQDNPSGCETGTGTYVVKFEIDASQLDTAYGLHFDLYNTDVADGDYDVDDFAPFSHDARYDCCSKKVPEPGMLALLGIGLLGLGFARRRKDVA